jgi:hypothetical protein
MSDAETTFWIDINSTALPGQPSMNGASGRTALTPYLPPFEPTRNWRGFRVPLGNLVDSNLRFDPVNGYLEVNSTWYCNDKRASRPYVVIPLYSSSQRYL